MSDTSPLLDFKPTCRAVGIRPLPPHTTVEGWRVTGRQHRFHCQLDEGHDGAHHDYYAHARWEGGEGETVFGGAA